MDNTYYDILELPRDATPAQIKKQFRLLSKKYHPDKLPEDKKEAGTEMFKKVNEANAVLSDPEKRKIYDKYGKEGLEQNGQMPHFNMEDLFGMGGFMGGMPGMPGMRRERPTVKPIKTGITLTMEQIYTGATIQKEIKRDSLCNTCDGTGSVDKQSHTCTTCRGKGVVVKIQQLGPGIMQQMQMPCNACGATGQMVKNKCTRCKGTKNLPEKHTVSVTVKPGTPHRFTIVVEDEGNEIPMDRRSNSNGKTRGDIVFVVQEEDHNVFKRGIQVGEHADMANLLMEVKITLAQSLCGFKHTYTHLDGKEKVMFEMNPIKDGEIRYISGEGMPKFQNPGHYGDLFIKYDVEYPKKITDEQKDKIHLILTGKSFYDNDFDLKEEDYLVTTRDINEYSPSLNEEEQGPEGGPDCHVQ